MQDTLRDQKRPDDGSGTAFGRQRQMQMQIDLYEVQDSQRLIVRPCLKKEPPPQKKTKKKTKKRGGRERDREQKKALEHWIP